jgi:hypothetical protein
MASLNYETLNSFNKFAEDAKGSSERIEELKKEATTLRDEKKVLLAEMASLQK